MWHEKNRTGIFTKLCIYFPKLIQILLNIFQSFSMGNRLLKFWEELKLLIRFCFIFLYIRFGRKFIKYGVVFNAIKLFGIGIQEIGCFGSFGIDLSHPIRPAPL